MKAITFPINPNESSNNVAVLQAALAALGFQINPNEVSKQIASDTTVRAVRQIQQANRLQVSDTILVDQATAAAINAMLKAKGLLDPQVTYSVSGKVLNGTGEGLSNKLVIAYDVDLKGAKVYRTAKTIAELNTSGGMQLLGSATTATDGSYSISFTDAQFNAAELGLADVVAYVVQDQVLILGSSRISTDDDYINGTTLTGFDIVLSQSIDRGVSEYTLLLQAINNFLKISGVAMRDIFNSADQISFLASEIKQDLSRVNILVKAFALAQPAANYPFAPELLYGLGRENITLSYEAIATTDQNKILAAWADAINSNIIDPIDQQSQTSFLQFLIPLAASQTVSSPSTDAGTLLIKSISLSTTDTNLQASFLNASQSYSGTPQDFWDNYLPKQPAFTNQPQVISSLLLTSQLSALTANHLPLVEALQTTKKIQNATDLLSFTDDDWNTLITASGVPDGIPGATDQEKAANYKAQMQTVVNAAFPTQKIALMVSADQIKIADATIKQELTNFFNEAKGFDIRTSIISNFTTPSPTGSTNVSAEVTNTLGQIQRLFAVSPTPDTLGTLYAAGYQSARQISGIPLSTFVNMHGTDLGGTDIAVAVHERAAFQTMRMEKAVMVTQELLNGATPSILMDESSSGNTSTGSVQSVISQNIPNYTTLFGSPDFCECSECRSVYGAAAYLVDLLQFLNNLAKNQSGSSPLDVFFTRRGDIAFLPLTCENTNTLIPYIDIVNEIMEYYVAVGPLDKAAAYDTGHTTSDELHANPQNTLQAAYLKLKDAIYPFTLPYHQALDTERVYFGQMNTSRAEVMTTLRNDPSSKTSAAISAETMLLSPEAYIIITGKDFDGNNTTKNVWDYYNYPDDNTMQASLWKIPEFLSRTGLLYAEVIDLLNTQFINPNQSILTYIESLFSQSTLSSSDIYQKLKVIAGGTDPSSDPDIMTVLTANGIASGDFKTWVDTNFPSFQSIITLYESASACDPTTTQLRTLQSIYENETTSGIPDEVYSKMHRFIRLWKIMSWNIFDLDVMINALGETDITTTLIDKLALLKYLTPYLPVPLSKVAVIWGSIQAYGNQPLYVSLFLNKASQRIDPVFQPDKWGAYLSDNTVLMKDHIPAILAAFRLTAQDFNFIIADCGLDLSNAILSLTNLSIIYRYVVLAKAISIHIADLCSIKSLFGVNPFSTFDSVPKKFVNINVQSTLDFVKLAANIQTSGFTVDQLKYIINDTANPRLHLGVTDADVQQALLAIRQGFISIDLDSPDSDLDNVTEDLVRTKMQLLYQGNIVEDFISTLNGTSVYFTTTDKNLAVTIPSPQSSYIIYIKGSGRLQCTGILGDGDQSLLDGLAGVTANFKTATGDLYSQPEEFLKDNFSDLFGSSLPDANKNLLNHPKQVSPLTYQQKLSWFYQLFLPYLKNRLRENFVIQNISNLINLDEPSTQVMVQAQLDQLVGLLAQSGLSANYYKDDTFTTIGLSQTDPDIDFDWGTGSPGPAIPAGKFSAQWDGWINPPANDDYTLVVEVDQADDSFELYLSGQLILQKASGDTMLSFEDVVTLSMGSLYPITLKFVEEINNSGIHLYWKTATNPKGIIDTSALYPATVYTGFAGWLDKYQRASLFVTGFALQAREISHFIQYKANFDNIDFTAISAVHWQRIFAYASLKGSLPASSATLIDVFEKADQTNPAPSIDDIIQAVVACTGWNVTTITFLAETQFSLKVEDFRNAVLLAQLNNAVQLVNKTGTSADLLAGWCVVQTDFNTLYDQAQSIKNTVKAQFEDAAWLKVAQKLSNVIRENQKDALIAYLLVQPALLSWGVIDADSLFDYFLIDVQMDACMDTSRIVQANAAIQLFISRCLLNLENRLDASNRQVGVTSDQIDQDAWSWMQYYRVWEANRQVFLYPENWLDPELRSDKSEFFQQLESELLQNDITTDTVETALYNYLEKLAQVAHLEICGMYQQNDPNGNLQTLHVFGRTHSKPHVYYYRTCDQFWHWSPWGKLPVDVKGVDGAANSISGNLLASGVHLTPVVWKDRLFIFWPEFVKKQDDTISSNTKTFNNMGNNTKVSDNKPNSYWEVSVGWSEYRNGKWLPKTISKEFFRPGAPFRSRYLDETAFTSFLSVSVPVEIISQNIFSLEVNSDFVEDLKEYFLFPSIDGGTNELSLSLIHNRNENQGYFQFTDIHNPVYASQGTGGVQATKGSAYDSFFMMLENSYGPLALKGNTYLSRSLDHKIIFSPQLTDFEQTLNYPFFFQDDRRSYFVRPTNISYWRRVIGQLANPKQYYFGAIDNVKQAAVNYQIPIVPPGPLKRIQSTQNIVGGTQSLSNAAAAVAISTQSYTSSSSLLVSSYNSAARYTGAFEEIPISGYRQPVGIIQYVYDKGLDFYTNYHPYAPNFIQNMNQGGIDMLMESDTNEGNVPTPDDNGALFESYYTPNFTHGLVQKPSDFASDTYYKENVAFDEYATYGMYNWELFYHVPLYIATRLSKNGKYADAMRWFRYIFDPTTSEPVDPSNPTARYWKVLPFKTTIASSLETYFENLKPGQPDDDISEWRANPFDPFLVARDRPIAFMKNVVMKYVDNLVAWGDDLFRTDTLENINLATELYVVAAHILGPRPESLPPRGEIKSETYHSLQPKLDAFSNALVQLENQFPFSSDIPTGPNPFPGSMLGSGSTLYFCIPDNDNLLQYWDTVADRLFKIRHCLNIEGVFAPPALFAPPINPGLLIQARASGMSIGSILADLNSPAPFYRFSYLVQKAGELCSEVKSLGASLLAALEKKDAEDLSRIRASQESGLLALVSNVRERQVLEAKSNTANLLSNRDTISERVNYYTQLLGIDMTVPAPPQSLPDDDSIDENTSLPGDTAVSPVITQIDVSLVDTDTNGVKIIPKEKEEMDKSSTAHDWQLAASVAEAIAGIAHAFPQMSIDGKPLGVGAGALWGGQNIGFAASSIASVARIFSTQYSYESSKASRMASFIRREQEWTQQANLALREIVQTDKQLVASYIREQIATHELEDHRRQLQNAQDIESYLQNLLDGHNRFTTLETYQWLRDQLFSTYKQSYQMAFDMAKKAEKAYQFELGIPNSSFIQYGYFDSSYQGLTAGEQLFAAIRQMEKSYIELNRREFELTKHISIAQTRPDVLVQLIQTGACSFSLPEELFDLDYPGHYFRRVKTVSISIPCVAGPYTTINATLRLMSNSIRINTLNGDSGYAHNNDSGVPTDDDRFVENNIPFSSIATSTAQNDSGLFELNFRDERYLPFEGAGVISTWRLELNGKYLQGDGSILDLSQFDYNSISDIIIHIRYTAREDAGLFRQNAIKNLQDFIKHADDTAPDPFLRFFDVKREFPNEWYSFMNPVNATDQQVLSLGIAPDRFPFFAQKRKISVASIDLLADGDNVVNNIQLNVAGNNLGPLNLVFDKLYGNLLHSLVNGVDQVMAVSGPPMIITYPSTLPNNTPLKYPQFRNLYLIVRYELI